MVMKKRLVAFMRTDCPICFRLESYLTDLALSRGISVEKVFIDTVGSSSLLGRYRFFIDQTFGGEEHVPILLLGEERWFVPKRTTRGVRREKLFWSEIDEACKNLIKEINRYLYEREEVLKETHEEMKEVRRWVPNMFWYRAVAMT